MRGRPAPTTVYPGRRRDGRRRPGGARSHERGTRWLSSLYGIPPGLRPPPGGRTGRALRRAARRYVDAGAEHVVVMVADDHAARSLRRARRRPPPGGPPVPRATGRSTDLADRSARPGGGAGMTPERGGDPRHGDDRHEPAGPVPRGDGPPGGPRGAGDAGVEPHELALVIVGNALGGRLCDQGCIRGQTWLRKAGLGDVPVVNVDNTCAGGVVGRCTSARWSPGPTTGPVLVLGVEKMWTGDRAATLAGIEDGLPADYRADMHARFRPEDNPAGSILMGLNDCWARQCMHERGATVEQIAAAAVKARRNASSTRWPRSSRPSPSTRCSASPQVAGVLTRLMCSSFTDGAAAVVLGRPEPAPRPDAPSSSAPWPGRATGRSTTTTASTETAEAAWEAFGVRSRATSTWSSCTTPPAPRRSSPSSRSASSATARPGRPPWPATPPSAGRASRSTRAAAWSAGATRWAPPASPRSSSWPPSSAGRAGDRQVDGARLGLAVNTGGVIEGDAGLRRHPRRRRRELSRCRASPSGAAASRCPTRS